MLNINISLSYLADYYRLVVWLNTGHHHYVCGLLDRLPAHVELVGDAEVSAHQVHDVVQPLQLLPRHSVNAQLLGKQVHRS